MDHLNPPQIGRPGELGTAIAREERFVSLLESLRFAVPLHLDQLRGACPQDVVRVGLRAARVIGERGDLLQFTDRAPRTAAGRAAVAAAFDALAGGLAALTLLHGAVTFADLHWCTRAHPRCPKRPRAEPEPVDAARIARVVALLDEYEAMCGAAGERKPAGGGPTSDPTPLRKYKAIR